MSDEKECKHPLYACSLSRQESFDGPVHRVSFYAYCHVCKQYIAHVKTRTTTLPDGPDPVALMRGRYKFNYQLPYHESLKAAARSELAERAAIDAHLAEEAGR